MVQEMGYNFRYELLGHPRASGYLLPIATVSVLAGDSGTPKDSGNSDRVSWAHLSQRCWNQLFTRAFFYGFSIQRRILFQGWADPTTACLAGEHSSSLQMLNQLCAAFDRLGTRLPGLAVR